MLWRCSGHRRLGCTFTILTTKPSEEGGHPKALRMSDPEVHTCSADKIAPLMQKFRLKLAKRMTEELDVGWSKIWNEERALLLASLSDNRELAQQVILEMSDVETFRKSAQRARGKMTPKIPTEHADMDPDKVFYIYFTIFCVFLLFCVLCIHPYHNLICRWGLVIWCWGEDRIRRPRTRTSSPWEPLQLPAPGLGHSSNLAMERSKLR